MSALTSEPLPECMLCETPTRRAVYSSNGGLCSSCAAGIQRVTNLLPPLKPDER